MWLGMLLEIKAAAVNFVEKPFHRNNESLLSIQPCFSLLDQHSDENVKQPCALPQERLTKMWAMPPPDDGAKHYFDNVSRFTVLHAKDLIQLMLPQIESAKTILNSGCGPATFGLAYLEAFPRGIPGQA